jgi:hypothetical protein
MEIHVGFCAAARRELVLQDAEACGRAQRDWQDLQGFADLLDFPSVGLRSGRPFCSVQQLGDDEDAGDDSAAPTGIVEPLSGGAANMLGIDDRVRIHEPDHGISSGAALPPGFTTFAEDPHQVIEPDTFPGADGRKSGAEPWLGLVRRDDSHLVLGRRSV